jgi:tRNA threonylcarbamoyladenosine biosynthesis protein TsaE
MIEEIYLTNSIAQTQAQAQLLADRLNPGDLLAFFGNLGSGKTTFIQGLAKGLGIKKRIISPTFIIIRTYNLENAKKKLKTFYHVDLYRTQSLNDHLGLGLDQIIEDENSIVALEWAEKLGNLLPTKRYEIYLNNLGDDKREIRIKKYE